MLIWLTSPVAGLLLSIGMLMILLWKCRVIPIFGLMVAGRTSLLLVGLKLRALLFICLLLRLPLRVLSGVLLKGMGMLVWSVAVLSCLSLGPPQTVQRAEFWCAILALQAYWPCHFCIDDLNVARTTGRLLDRGSLTEPSPLVEDGDLVALVQYKSRTRGRDTVRVT